MGNKLKFKAPARQKGATLVIALLVLILIMMIGITAVNVSGTQFKLAGNLQFEDSAMNNAETAITVAEKWLRDNAKNSGFTTYSSSSTPYLYPSTATDTVLNAPLATSWSDSNSICAAVEPANPCNPAQRYMIQMLAQDSRLNGANLVDGPGICSKVNVFEITGRGTSARGAVKVVRSVFTVLSC